MRAPSHLVPDPRRSAVVGARLSPGPRRLVRGRLLAVVSLIAAVVVTMAPGAPPAAADPADGWQAVSAGDQFVCAIAGDDSAWCWGSDNSGQLGNGAAITGTKHAPSLVDLPGVDFTAVTAGNSHACGIDSAAGGWCWGSDSSGQLGEGPGGAAEQSAPVPIAGNHKWAALAAGGAHTCGITIGGSGYCWGSDTFGQVGNGATAGNQHTPVLLGTGWTAITTGAFHTCGLQGTTLACWGRGENGRLGNGDTANVLAPEALEPPASGGWSAVSGGWDHSCALTTQGALWCFGRDFRGQLGNGAATTGDQSKPVQVNGTWKAIDVGRNTSCAIDVADKSWCWGIDENRELGNGPALTGDQASPTAVDLAGGVQFSTISAGGLVTCGLTRGDVLCAGARTNGSVGDGLTTLWAESPVSVARAVRDQQITFAPLPDRVFGSPPFTLVASSTSGLPVSFAGGGSCSVNGTTVTIFDLGTCSVTASQAGNATYRPAPNVTRTFTVTPAVAAGTWARVDAGSEHTCAVTTVGDAWCWGLDEFGQLGNGVDLTDDQHSPSPVVDPVGGPVEWADVSAGTEHSCGTTTDGRAFCWGRDIDGRLGNGGAFADSPVPEEVPEMGASPWLHVSAGGSHSCGLTEEGAAYCWGSDLFGQLGNGAATGNQPSPVQVPHPDGDEAWVDISAGGNHTCAVDADRSTWCWGLANLGQLGLGPAVTTGQASPQRVLLPTDSDTEVASVELGWNRSCHIQVVVAGPHTSPDAVAWCWGGNGTFNQTPSATGEVITDVGVGLDHRCFLGADGIISCAGANTAGQAGLGPIVSSGSGEIVGTNGVAWRAVSAGGIHTCAISTTGNLSCWGYDNHGQVGSGTNEVPTPSTDPLVRWLPNPVYLPETANGLGELRVTTSPAVPSQIVVDGLPRDVWGLTWMDIEMGEHEVCFTDVVGFATPPCEVVTVPEGGTGTVTGTFVPLVSLQVSTSPALPGTISVNGVPRDDWGVFTWVPAGQALQVCFGPVAGYTPPSCQNVAAGSVNAGVPIALTGTYTPNGAAPAPTGKGFLRVTTSPALPATITVNGEARDDWGLDWLQVDPGNYQVCFSDVLGYTTPDCQEVVVAAGATATVAGTFAQLGWINATTSPPSEKTIKIDGVSVNDWGAWPPVAPGPHQVCFTRYAVTPLCRVVHVTAGATTAVDDA